MKNVFFSAAVAALLFTSCSNDDDAPAQINPEETINRVELTITTSDNQTITSTWNEGEAVPTFNLPTNLADMSVKFYDATDPNDVEDITLEVIEEADEHFVVYSWANAPEFRIGRSDDDVTQTGGAKIGIRTVIDAQNTAVAGGTLEIRLMHEPESVSDACGNTSCGSVTGGEEDVRATFNFTAL